MARIYAASSWRNPDQPAIVAALRDHGHEVYDFRNPFNGRPGFAWSEIDPEWQSWSAKRYRELLTTSPIAAAGYVSDLRAMEWADTCVLILPCGRSAHLEAGWFCGRGKRCIILTRDGEEPELMALLATDICISVAEVIKVLREKHPCGNGWSDHEDFRAAMLRRTGDPIYAPAPLADPTRVSRGSKT